ncbi:MAG TPA: questin oxidase family protein [Planctomycetota bacterium]
MTELDPTTSSRRRFLASSAALAAGAAVGDAARGAQAGAPADGTAPLEAAYVRIQARYPHSNVHRSNHVPMVVEALATLGRADAIGPWLDEHLEAYDPDEGPRNRIDAARWREVLGDHAYFTDWRELFLAELAADDWRAVLGRWVPRFTPGLAGAATHGVIRTGHAARALAAHDSAVRRAELATGLAYWAVNFEELPWDGSLAPERSVADALARVVLRRPAEEPPRGNIVTGLRALQDTPSFHPVAGWVGVEDPARTLGEMASAFARLYLANPERRIAFTHAITAPSALRLLVPYLDEETVRAATRRAWQAAAGLFVVYGVSRGAEVAARPAERAALIAACVANGGAHSIKLTEACLREEAFSRDPILLAAARDAGQELNG